MFRSIYENINLEKKFIDLNHNRLFPLLFKKSIFIVSAGYPLQNLLTIFTLKIFFKTIYVYTPFGFELKYFNVKFSKLKEILVNFIYSGNNVKLITCSKEQNVFFKKRYPKKEIFHFNNFSEHKRINNTLITTKNNIYYIGRIDQKQKNCLIFRDLAENNNYLIHLIGDLDSEILADKLNHTNITIYKKVINPYENIPNNSCIILPSFYEGAALVVIEACIYNIPIFLSNCVGNSNFAESVITFNNLEELNSILFKYFNKDISLNQQWMKFRDNVLKTYNKETFLSQIKRFENHIK